MRCQKCGYISFDHMETCLKCNKKMSGKIDIEGTTYQADPPSFLRVPQCDTSESGTGIDSTDSFDTDDDFEDEEDGFADPELAAFAEEEDGEDIAFDDTESDDFLLEDDDESAGEDAFEFELEDDELNLSQEDSSEPVLNVPDALADISDLAPPAVTEIPNPVDGDEISLSLDDEISMDDDLGADLDLGGLDLDLDLGLGDDSASEDADLSLSLDDIGLSAEDITEKDDGLDGLSMDLDLDLDESPAPPASKKEEKAPGSLDGLSLSLE